ncbi:TetR family transcriptional regulator [Solirubrobacter pauli]|uniref:TetR family transcriptional regulator n=1 Tax=Solirubrobacter pauli TaxID=166793 RepID=A0A660L214_9ACTN|nr:TetR/AcrR family transcriptional regulator [Solirubrobacter pauli]RKQ87355.1 TetR family transcriptional regulator [Solirubrobacter pauli]
MTQPLTSERILAAAEDVLRRHGPQKANVVDVARALGVSHGAVYRHFASKQALREAVTRRWLHEFHTILEPIDEPRAWIRALSAAKRGTARVDPELFATYSALCDEQSAVVDEHVAWMVGQLEAMVGDKGRPLLQATTRFHHPAHVHEWSDPEIEHDLERVLDLVLPPAQ